jgi:hypothetical protein
MELNTREYIGHWIMITVLCDISNYSIQWLAYSRRAICSGEPGREIVVCNSLWIASTEITIRSLDKPHKKADCADWSPCGTLLADKEVPFCLLYNSVSSCGNIATQQRMVSISVVCWQHQRSLENSWFQFTERRCMYRYELNLYMSCRRK